MTTPPLHRQASAIPLACVPAAIPAAERAAHFVRLTGPEGTRAFLDAELPAIPSLLE